MPDTRNFAVGDVVRLRSGSPLMTVIKTAPEGVTCTWFDVGPNGHGGELQTAAFVATVLDAGVDPRAAQPTAAAAPPAGGIRSRLGR